MDKINVFIDIQEEGMGHGTFMHRELEKVEIQYDKTKGKNKVEVKINGEVIFRYDSNSKNGMTNFIQRGDLAVGELDNATITEANITTETISDTSKPKG